MNKISTSTKTFFILVIILAVFSGLNLFLPQSSIMPITEQALPAPKPIMATAIFFFVIFIYGGLGFIGLKLSEKINFPNIWEQKISIKRKLVSPTIIGIIVGLIFVIVDIFYTKVFSIKQLHPEFPLSIIASLSAGIGEEIIYRLFIISFWVWLVSNKIFKQKYQNTIFWIVTITSSLAFAFAHIPALMFLGGYKTFSDIPIELILEIILLNGLVSIFCAINFRKNGIISAMAIHFWTDIIWHVVWGNMNGII